MTTAEVAAAMNQSDSKNKQGCSSTPGEGLKQYYMQHMHASQIQLRNKTHNLNHLEAQRNQLNSQGMNFPNGWSPFQLHEMKQEGTFPRMFKAVIAANNSEFSTMR